MIVPLTLAQIQTPQPWIRGRERQFLLRGTVDSCYNGAGASSCDRACPKHVVPPHVISTEQSLDRLITELFANMCLRNVCSS